jgi:alkylated DNA nucleotide flippase Atl1
LAAIEKLLLVILIDADGAVMSRDTLAAYLGVTERRVGQLLSGLKQRGVLSTYRVARTNRYRLHFSRLAGDIREHPAFIAAAFSTRSRI